MEWITKAKKSFGDEKRMILQNVNIQPVKNNSAKSLHPKVEITSDQLDYDFRTQKGPLKNVNIIFPQSSLFAPKKSEKMHQLFSKKGFIDLNQQTLTLVAPVQIKGSYLKLEGKNLVLNLENEDFELTGPVSGEIY